MSNVHFQISTVISMIVIAVSIAAFVTSVVNRNAAHIELNQQALERLDDRITRLRAEVNDRLERRWRIDDQARWSRMLDEINADIDLDVPPVPLPAEDK